MLRTIQENISAVDSLRFPTYVYNAPLFLKHNNNEEQRHFYVCQGGIALAHAAFTIKEGVAYCPLRSPFGGLEYNMELDELALSEIISELEGRLVHQGISEIHYHQAPSAYQDDSLIKKAFFNSNYTLFQERIFHGIEVNDQPLWERMHKMEQRKYQKCLENGATFKQLKKKDAIDAFMWIERHRSLAEKPSSMNSLDLKNASTRNPNVYSVFGVFMDGYLLAATVLVRVNKKSVYHFLPTSMEDFPQYKKFSPMVFLVHELYGWCQENGIELLDLGTSYVDKRIKATLVQFKEHLGGTKSIALSWRKRL